MNAGVYSLLHCRVFCVNLVPKSNAMRSMLLTLSLLLNTVWLFSQDDVFSNKTNIALEKVIRDYPNRFHNIRGEVLVQHPKTTEYKSTIQVPGSSACIITKYSLPDNDSYSWNCHVFQSREFSQAKNKFREIYDQIENTIIKVDGE